MLAPSRATLIVGPLLLGACHTWNTVPLSPKSAPLPAHSRVVLAEGERVPIRDGRATPDSIGGTHYDVRRHAVSRDGVVLVEERDFSAGRSPGGSATGGSRAATVAAVVVVVLILSLMGPF